MKGAHHSKPHKWSKPQTGLVNKVLGLGLVLERDVDVLAHDARHLVNLLLHIRNRGAPAVVSVHKQQVSLNRNNQDGDVVSNGWEGVSTNMFVVWHCETQRRKEQGATKKKKKATIRSL